MTFSNLSNENMLLFMPPPFCILGRAYQVGHIALLLSVCISVGLLIGRSTNSSLIFCAEVAHTAVLGFASWTQKHYLQFLFNLFAKVALTDTLESFQQSYALWTQKKQKYLQFSYSFVADVAHIVMTFSIKIYIIHIQIDFDFG